MKKCGVLKTFPPVLCSLSLFCPVSNFFFFKPGTKLEKRVQRDGKYNFFFNSPHASTWLSISAGWNQLQIHSRGPSTPALCSTSALSLIFLALLFLARSLLFLCIRGQSSFLCGLPVLTALCWPLALFPRGRRMNATGLPAQGTTLLEGSDDVGYHRNAENSASAFERPDYAVGVCLCVRTLRYHGGAEWEMSSLSSWPLEQPESGWQHVLPGAVLPLGIPSLAGLCRSLLGWLHVFLMQRSISCLCLPLLLAAFCCRLLTWQCCLHVSYRGPGKHREDIPVPSPVWMIPEGRQPGFSFSSFLGAVAIRTRTTPFHSWASTLHFLILFSVLKLLLNSETSWD